MFEGSYQSPWHSMTFLLYSLYLFIGDKLRQINLNWLIKYIDSRFVYDSISIELNNVSCSDGILHFLRIKENEITRVGSGKKVHFTISLKHCNWEVKTVVLSLAALTLNLVCIIMPNLCLK